MVTPGNGFRLFTCQRSRPRIYDPGSRCFLAQPPRLRRTGSRQARASADGVCEDRAPLRVNPRQSLLAPWLHMPIALRLPLRFACCTCCRGSAASFQVKCNCVEGEHWLLAARGWMSQAGCLINRPHVSHDLGKHDLSTPYISVPTGNTDRRSLSLKYSCRCLARPRPRAAELGRRHTPSGQAFLIFASTLPLAAGCGTMDPYRS